MKNKPSDVEYCGIRKEIVNNAKPVLNHENLKHFFDWFTERYKIHIKKDIEKLKGPWTNDKILLNYRFTNVRREHDRETRWLIENIVNSNMNYENKLLNIILFRLINKSSSFEIFGKIDFDNFNPEELKRRIVNFRQKNPDYIFFSNAFFTSGQKNAANKLFPQEKDNAVKMILLTDYFKSKGITEKIKNCGNQKEVFNLLNEMPGLGNFLSYQIFVDFTYIPEFPFSENEFVVAGPGCVNGLKFLFEDFSGMNYEEALFWLRDNQKIIFQEFGYAPDELFSDLDKDERYLNLMSLENCMCEISKYIRALNGNGRPRIRYKG